MVAGDRETRGWLVHSLAFATGIASREGDRGLVEHLIDKTIPLMQLDGDSLPRGVGAELAVELTRILGGELSDELREQLELSRVRALAIELARAHADVSPL